MKPRFRRVCVAVFEALIYDYWLLLQVLRLLGIVLGFCVRHNFPLGISVAPSLFKVSSARSVGIWKQCDAEAQLLLRRAPELEDLKYEQEDE